MNQIGFGSKFKLRWLAYLALFIFWSIWLINLNVLNYKRYVVQDCLQDIAGHLVVIVLGAPLIDDNQLSPIFIDRLETARIIYEQGKADKILISGNGRRYNEVNPARDYLLENDVNQDDIFLDYQGNNTFSSFYRAKNLFMIDQTLVVTQDFHLPRALYLARKLDIDALGCQAINDQNNNFSKFKQREIFARIKAWLDINLGVSLRSGGQKFNISGSGQQTWQDY